MSSVLSFLLSIMLLFVPKEKSIDSTLNIAVVSNNKALWEKEINYLAGVKDSLNDYHYSKYIELIYGYIGWNIKEGQKEESLKYIEYLHYLIDKENSNISFAEKSAYLAAIISYKIILNKEDIIIGGIKSYKAAKRAIKANPNLPLANIIMANVTLNVPSILKDKYSEAIKYYNMAIKIFERDNKVNNWQYYNALNSIANLYKRKNKKKELDKILKKIENLKNKFLNLSSNQEEIVIMSDSIIRRIQ